MMPEVEMTLLPELETEAVEFAAFAPPSGIRPGPREAALLPRDALKLSLRRGAGPFRGAGRIHFEPRAYQLAPLMMALRQDTRRAEDGNPLDRPAVEQLTQD